jgi:NAD(P)-dependent dehydrogenase (short-subunit alcohol dehydrogenase family)
MNNAQSTVHGKPIEALDDAETYLDANPDHAKAYLQQIALGRFGNSYQDIGPIAVFLCSTEAGYLTGQRLNTDGGQVML